MRRDKLGAIIITISICAGISTAGFYGLLKTDIIKYTKSVKEVPVYVASRQLNPGDMITSKDFKIVNRDITQAVADSQLGVIKPLGQVATQKIQKNLPLTSSMMEDSKEVYGDDLYPYSIAVTTPVGINKFDKIALAVNYKTLHTTDVVVSEATVTKIVSQDNKTLTSTSGNGNVSIVVMLSLDDVKKLDDASKVGVIYPIKYSSTSSPLKETYKMVSSSTSKVDEQ